MWKIFTALFSLGTSTVTGVLACTTFLMALWMAIPAKA
jgi:hypothetical protein